MSQTSPLPQRNLLLAALSSADLALLQPDLEPVSLELRQALETANEPITHSYFIDHGLASIVASNGNKRRIEVGLVGFEGMTGLAVVLGKDRSPNENFTQVGGDGRAHKIRPAACGDAEKSLTATRLAQFRPFLHEPDFKHRAVKRHIQH